MGTRVLGKLLPKTTGEAGSDVHHGDRIGRVCVRLCDSLPILFHLGVLPTATADPNRWRRGMRTGPGLEVYSRGTASAFQGASIASSLMPGGESDPEARMEELTCEAEAF